MEIEKFFSGYCRQLDASRMVEVILEDSEVTEVDCCYGNCLYQLYILYGTFLINAINL